MSKTMKAFSFALFAALAVASAPVARAQQSKAVPAAPIPSQILAAKTVFISNAGGEVDVNLGGLGNYGAPDGPYNQFYAAVKAWGRYQLVDSPSAADLIFQIQFSISTLAGTVTHGAGTTEDPQFRLVILDPKTNVILWAFTEHVEPAVLQGNRDKNLGTAFHALMTDLMQLVAPQT